MSPNSPLNIAFGLDRASAYGTTRAEYKLWVDYIFDWFGATLEKRFRRYLVAGGFAVLVWSIGLLISFAIGFSGQYITTPAIYYFTVGIAWCTNSLRWLSQVYHNRTNVVRPCFPVDDRTYKNLVSPFARQATNNRRIFIRTILYTTPVILYFGAVILGYIKPLSILSLAFPPSFQNAWLGGDLAAFKWLIVAINIWVAYSEVYTGIQLTLSTAPLYGKLATLPVLPLPNLISELFQGVLNLYLSGAIMWSFGIVLVELLYETRLDPLGLAFAAAVIGLGIFAYLVPLEAVRRIWRKSKHNALDETVTNFYSKASHSADELRNTNEYIKSLGDSEPGNLNLSELVGFVGGQLLPFAPLLLNSYFTRFLHF